MSDIEIAKIHSNSLDHATGSDDQDLSGLQPKESGKGLYPDVDASKLTGIQSGAQVNANITKEEIEAKLIGEISTHTHAGGNGGLTQAQTLTRQL